MRRLVLLLLLLLAVPAHATVQSAPPWGLDRIDQRALPLDHSFRWGSGGEGVTVFVVDTGIRLSSHDFAGRAVTGVDEVDGGEATDCNGHGTHVAGLVGGSRFGVAKKAHLVAVRVLDCNGRGTSATVQRGLDWVLAHHSGPSVLNLSLGGAPSAALDKQVRALVRAGITVVVAAGNDGADACQTSPARTHVAITVSATDIHDGKPAWANTGTCVDLFAPGLNISSDWDTSDSASKTISGTSMAAPLVAGAAAVWLGLHPSATPAQVRAALVRGATTGVVAGHGTAPDRLLHVTGQ
ncbi:MAG: putative subtilase-family protease [Frankiales bacterium]|nr:putative subtilase-family protease [Frankiales bacterium]